MNRKKRIYAKIIDVGILFFVFLIFTKLSSGSPILYYLFTYPLVSILIFYVYFGVLGNHFKGSLGKKMVGLTIINKKDNFVPNMLLLFVREPIIQMFALTGVLYIFGLTIYNILVEFALVSNSVVVTPSVVITLVILVSILVILIYLISFITHHDWWNKKYKIMLDK